MKPLDVVHPAAASSRTADLLLGSSALALAAASVTVWAALGSAVRSVMPELYQMWLAIVQAVPVLRAASADQLASHGYVSGLGFHAIVNDSGAQDSALLMLANAVNGDAVAAALACSASLPILCLALRERHKAGVADRKYNRLLERLARANH